MRSSSWYAFNVLAYSDKWNCYGSTDKSAGCSVAFFYNFFVLFAKGGIISITIFPFFLLLCLRQVE